MSHDPMDRNEIESLLAARQELGPTMEPALVDSFAEKIMAEVQRQTYLQNQNQWQKQQMAQRARRGNGPQLGLGIVSLVLAIPLTAVPLAYNNPWMAVIIWVGIVLVNLSFAMRNRDQS